MKQKLLTWFRKHGRHDLPWRQSPTPYDVLVSEFMLQQTTVATIIPRFQEWMNRFPTLKKLAAASEAEVLTAWQGLGYYARARRLHQVAQSIVNFHHGKIPADLSTLLSLPGIGPYTASALLAFAFDQPTVVLDTNIIRVIARLHNITEPIDSKNGKELIAAAAQLILPKKNGYAFASALMDLGSMICTASNPQCSICPLSSSCQAEEPATLPHKKPKPSITRKQESRIFYQHDDLIYLEHSAGPHWKGLWILPLASAIPLHNRPLSKLAAASKVQGASGATQTRSVQNVLEDASTGATQQFAAAVEFSKRSKNYLTSITYPITRYRITMKLYRGIGTPPKNLHAFSKKDLKNLAIPSPHRKALEKLVRN